MSNDEKSDHDYVGEHLAAIESRAPHVTEEELSWLIATIRASRNMLKHHAGSGSPPIELVYMADGVMQHSVGPADKVKVVIAQGYRGPFAGDASGKVHISVNGREVLRVRGTYEDIL